VRLAVVRIHFPDFLLLAEFCYILQYLSITLKQLIIMDNLLYIIAVILIIGWAVGFFAYGASGLIHVLLVIAIIAILLKVIRRA
jgi:hypothetical protein